MKSREPVPADPAESGHGADGPDDRTIEVPGTTSPGLRDTPVVCIGSARRTTHASGSRNSVPAQARILLDIETYSPHETFPPKGTRSLFHFFHITL